MTSMNITQEIRNTDNINEYTPGDNTVDVG